MKKYSTIIAAFFLLALNAFASDSTGYKGVKTLILDSGQLKKIGITVLNDRVEVYSGKSVKLLIKSNKIDIVSSRKPAPEGLECFPRFVVNQFAKSSSVYYNKLADYANTEGYENLNSNGLVCVRIDASLKDRNKRSQNTVYLWFDCTEELVKLLPTYKKVELMAELFDSTGINSQEPAYTDMYKMFNGALSSSLVKPNPIFYQDGVLDFRLDESRVVNIEMYDVSGNHRRNFVSNTYYDKGNHSVSLDFGGYADGMYIIVITTNKNERVIQRVIKAS